MNDYSSVLDQVSRQVIYLASNNPIAGAWHYLKKWFFYWLIDIIAKFNPNYSVSDQWLLLLFQIVMAVVGIGFVALIAWCGYYFLGRRVQQNKKRFLFGEQIEAGDEGMTFYNRGVDMANNGSYTEAIRLQFIGLLLLIEAKGVMHVYESWTNTEISTALLQHHASFSPRFELITAGFNRWCFGPVPAKLTDYQEWLSAIDGLWKVVGSDGQ